MKRRGFIKKLSITGATPFMLNGLPLTVLGQSTLKTLAASGADNDKVLVLIQLHGGNDGLNTIIPVDQYGNYINLRPNVAISDSGSRGYIDLDNSLNVQEQVGLHPDMLGIKELYDEGKAAIVQAVGYENLNQSHFRSRDIWWMGGGYDDEYSSGWAGRYLDHCFPGYPDDYPSTEMPDPLGLEIGNNVSLMFHRETGIPAAISARNPNQFYDLITSVGGLPPESVADTHYGQELQWIMDIEEKSNQYAGRLKDVFENGMNSANVTYPEKYPFDAGNRFSSNPLAGQLQLIARLLSGGSKTKIFLAKIGGFDTHADQVVAGDPSMGAHAALLYHVSSAVKAFQDDLKFLGLEDRVVTMTFSEFGRRAASNGSYGTDHGTAAPMFVFGKGVRPGVYGTNPDLADLDRGNLRHQFDYRQVFAAVLQDWMGASNEALVQTRFDQYAATKVDVFGTLITGTKEEFFNNRFRLDSCYPNPAKEKTNFSYYINNASHVRLKIYDTTGQMVKVVVDEHQSAGEHQVTVDLTRFKAGAYLYKIDADNLKATKRLIVQNR
ncbi:DUF1501 domain-containing protein [Fulvivirgaceae bacterium BMA12]|uniref:DUF1501 domain-containing protein n=1 Tax=Agaribacillus aureus TaxID=3051825 RepID=A0ABT8LE79_9BACT|nr:DUF1501 domain-containing protein [Fulvivirgaceae bacterium BMA12]